MPVFSATVFSNRDEFEEQSSAHLHHANDPGRTVVGYFGPSIISDEHIQIPNALLYKLIGSHPKIVYHLSNRQKKRRFTVMLNHAPLARP